jgi:uncharacterized protein
MANMPEEVVRLINDPESSRVLATHGKDGNIHAVQLGSIKAVSPSMIVLGAILMKHSSENLEAMKKKGELVSILAMKKIESYQVKAKVKDYQTSGPAFEKMDAVIKQMGLTLRGVWILEPAEVWNQSANYEAGKRIV